MGHCRSFIWALQNSQFTPTCYIRLEWHIQLAVSWVCHTRIVVTSQFPPVIVIFEMLKHFKGNMPKRKDSQYGEPSISIHAFPSTSVQFIYAESSHKPARVPFRHRSSALLCWCIVSVFLLSFLAVESSAKPIILQQDQGPPQNSAYFKKLSYLAEKRRQNTTRQKYNDGKPYGSFFCFLSLWVKLLKHCCFMFHDN